MPSIDLSFSRYVASRKKAGSARVREGALYAYGGDLRVKNALDKLRPVTLAVEASVRFWNAVGKNKLLGHAVRVSEKQFPKLHALGAKCGKALQVPPPTIFVSPELKPMETRTFGGNDDAVVLVSGSLMDHLSEPELMFVIGRECGHIQNGHTVYLTALQFLSTTKNPVFKMGAQSAALALRGWVRRSEITADRAGLLCAQDLAPARTALAKVAIGAPHLFPNMNIDEYLAEVGEGVRGPGRWNELLATKPQLPKRLAALTLFAQTSFYRSLVGASAGGGISKEECDAKVSELLAVLK